MKVQDFVSPPPDEEDEEETFCAAGGDDDPDEEGQMESDLNDALELLESWLVLAEGMMRKKNKGRWSWQEEKELEDLAQETTGFLAPWVSN